MKLIGLCRLGKDAEVRYTPDGKAVSNLSLAYSYGQKGDRSTQWVNASLWGERVEKLAPYLTKGTMLNVMCGDVHIRTYEGKNGAGAELVGRVIDLEFAGSKREGDAPASDKPSQSAKPAAKSAQQTPFDDMDDDISF